ncbi:MAG: YihY family inner membrane protein [Phycisphaerales bacterium]|nr:YihY family inner membrane protein [Phycisphaerales bacterium]
MDVLRKSSRGLDIARYCVRHLAEVRAPDMAAALSFRTLFGLVPVLFVATIVTRSLAGARFPAFVKSLANMAGLNDIGLNVATDGADGVEKQQLGLWIEELVRFSATLDLSTLGLIGFGAVLFSAIWLIVAIENTFNIVCRAPNSRPWHRRILVYWSVLTLGPILLATIPLLDGELKNFLSSEIPLPVAYVTLRPILGFFLLFALLFFSYSVIPTDRMRWKTLAAGALVGAIGLELGRSFLGIYMDHAFTVNRLYGSLGLVPVFMFWVYTMWLIVLFGLQVSSLLHALMSDDRMRGVLKQQSTSFEPAIAVCAMAWICLQYSCAKPANIAGLAEQLHLDLTTTTRLATALAHSNLIVNVANGGVLIPSRSADSLCVRDALEVGFTLAGERSGVADRRMLNRLRDAQLKAVENQTFASDPTCKMPAATTELNGTRS